jgi:pimeloyl-ACP methyl ester carboxylesterase
MTIESMPLAPAFDRDSGRARLPDRSGVASADDGVRLAFDVYGSGSPTIVLLPSAPIVHSRQWKAQVPYLARQFRVVKYDGRGNGRSDRPTDPAAYADDRMTADIRTILDASVTEPAIRVRLCRAGA